MTPFLQPDEMTAEQRRVYEQIVASRGTWLMVPLRPCCNSRAWPSLPQTGEFLRYHTSLGPLPATGHSRGSPSLGLRLNGTACAHCVA
jgi:hypothetical protein